MVNLSSRATSFYNIFKLPKVYLIDKSDLKRSYYSLSKKINSTSKNMCPNDKSFLWNVSNAFRNMFSLKKTEPDLNLELLNESYTNLNDDFLRAKIFYCDEEKESVDSSKSHEFLDHCLDLEERIAAGADLKNYLSNIIDECKKNVKDSESVNKWGYYRSLVDKMNNI